VQPREEYMTGRWRKYVFRISSLLFVTSLTAIYGADSGCSRSGAQPRTPATAPEKDANASRVYLTGKDVASLSDVFASISAKVSRSVVSIRVESKQARQRSPFDFFFGNPPGGGGGNAPDSKEEDFNIVRGGGSGVIITTDGYILTNNHVVKDATRIEVKLQDKRHFTGRVVGTDAATDLAVVKISAQGLPAAGLADSSKARVGEWVLAIGSPFGLDYTVTAGVLSATGRGGLGASEIEDYLQTDASINPGNSGGPLVNLSGEVLGINTMIIGRGTGIGFAIPSNLARNVSEQLKKGGEVKRAWIGVGFQELTPDLAQRFGVKEQGGALISSVVPSDPADKAGLKAGDIIVKVDGKDVREGPDLLRMVISKPVGSVLTLEVIRGGQRVTKKLTTANRPKDLSVVGKVAPEAEAQSPSGFGIELQTLTPQLAERLDVKAQRGAIVVQVKSGSPGDRAGLQRGDVIVEADRKPATSVDDVINALKDGSALLRVERQTGAYYVVLSKE